MNGESQHLFPADSAERHHDVWMADAGQNDDSYVARAHTDVYPRGYSNNLELTGVPWKGAVFLPV